mmetsp:Transcript_18148/g.40295  ORF Transcript_18148/g.40295 Transcript_18148/m.40295 type:complete len:234 (-) Transcript_18148:115-816(-)
MMMMLITTIPIPIPILTRSVSTKIRKRKRIGRSIGIASIATNNLEQPAALIANSARRGTAARSEGIPSLGIPADVETFLGLEEDLKVWRQCRHRAGLMRGEGGRDVVHWASGTVASTGGGSSGSGRVARSFDCVSEDFGGKMQWLLLLITIGVTIAIIVGRSGLIDAPDHIPKVGIEDLMQHRIARIVRIVVVVATIAAARRINFTNRNKVSKARVQPRWGRGHSRQFRQARR